MKKRIIRKLIHTFIATFNKCFNEFFIQKDLKHTYSTLEVNWYTSNWLLRETQNGSPSNDNTGIVILKRHWFSVTRQRSELPALCPCHCVASVACGVSARVIHNSIIAILRYGIFEVSIGVGISHGIDRLAQGLGGELPQPVNCDCGNSDCDWYTPWIYLV